MRISILLPTYQEAENLYSLLPSINKALRDVDHEILVIDTMEPMDNTKAICDDNQAKYVSRRKGNCYGDAIRTGIEEASGDYLAVMDADGSHDPSYLAEFLSEMETGKYDLIIGSRYCEGGHTNNSIVSVIMSRALNTTYRLVFGLKAKDVSNSFRLYQTNQVKTLKLDCNDFDIVEEILIKLNMSIIPFRVKEVPITFNKRVDGESKRELGTFIKSYIRTIVRLMIMRKKESKAGD